MKKIKTREELIEALEKNSVSVEEAPKNVEVVESNDDNVDLALFIALHNLFKEVK